MTEHADAPALVAEPELLHRPAAREVAAALVAVAGPAAVSLHALGNTHQAVPALLYVLVVIAAAALGGRTPGLVAAAVSAVPFYYFFITPYHMWSVKWDGVLALAVFLLTAIGGGEVLARELGARTRAEEEASSSSKALDTALRLQFVADALVSAMTQVEQLLQASMVRIAVEDPAISRARRIGRPVRRAEALDPAALLVDQNGRFRAKLA